MSVQPIRQNSTDKVSIGPAVSISDGFTLNTSLTLSGADSARAKLGDNSTVDISGYTWAATTNMDGEFDLTLQTGISDTIGPMTILIEDVSLILPIRETFYVYDPAVYDALFADSPTLVTARDIGQLYESTIQTVNSQDQPSFDMDVSIVSDDNWIGQICIVQDVGTGETVVRWIADVDQVNDRLILDDNGPLPFTVAVADVIRIESRVHPTFALQLYDPPTRAELTTDTNSVLNRIRDFFRIIVRKDAGVAIDQSARITDINEDLGNGPGNYDNTTDSLEANPLTFTVAGLADVNVQAVEDIVLKEDGAGGQNIGGV